MFDMLEVLIWGFIIFLGFGLFLGLAGFGK